MVAHTNFGDAGPQRDRHRRNEAVHVRIERHAFDDLCPVDLERAAVVADRQAGDGAHGKRRTAAAITIHPRQDKSCQRQAGMETAGSFHSILTGQRIGDILEMRWSHIEGDGINVKQNKTGVELYIPFTARLRSYLAQTPKKGFTIVTTIHGTEMSYNAVEQRFRTVRERAGIGNYVMHGWRYTAAQQLLLAGCSDAEIGAITGHKSLEMIAKYSRKGQQAQLARTAQEKRK